jgi:hypothetical protein
LINDKLNAIIAILEQSDIVWTRYGSETIQELAKKILNKVEEKI